MSRFPETLIVGGLALLAVGFSASAQDVAAGEKLFAKCKTCHAVGEGAKNRVGPHLNDLFGRAAGTVEGYRYSPAMTEAGEAGLVWDAETLKAFLADPRGFVKGTKMAFAGFKKDDELANMIAYLETFSSAPPEQQSQVAPAEPAATQADAAVAAETAPSDARQAETGPGDGLVLKLGRAATAEEIAAWDIDVRPDGQGLPVGSGSVSEGEPIFDAQCASCHGDFGEAVGRWPPLAGGHGSLRDERPVKTVGSYWPYLSTVYDYVRRAMPFGNARSLTNDEVYALTAYILYLNDVVVDESFEFSNENFASVKLPNEENFIGDDRISEPHYAGKAEPCTSNCIPGAATIKMHATVLDVTPEQSGSDEAPAAGID